MVAARRVVFRPPGVFRDVFLTRHAHVAIEITVRVSRTSPDLQWAPLPFQCVCLFVCYGER